jgi:hypothetical protein
MSRAIARNDDRQDGNMNRIRLYALIASSAALLGSVLASCSGVALDSSVLSRAKDTSAPTLTITSPVSGYECANIVEIRGQVADKTNDGGSGKVSSLAYEIPGSLLSGAVAPAADGSFVLQLDTDSLKGRFSVKLTAVDWNGNKTSAGLDLDRLLESSLPTFSAVGRSKAIVLTWDEVPSTESYTVYYTSNGALPSDTVGTQITDAISPYTVNCDENGLLYTFVLKAVAVQNPGSPANPDSQSNYVKAIPLSDQTLCPEAISGRGEITLSWKAIAATNEFEIYRRVGEHGEFSFYRRVIGNQSVDTSVDTSENYYYCVKPSEYSSVLSAAGVNRTDGFARGYGMSVVSGVSLWFPSMTWRDDLIYASGLGGVQILLASQENYELARISKTVVYQAAAPAGSKYLYLAAGKDGFLIYDINNPIVPASKGSYTAPGIDVRGLVVDSANGRAWIADYCKTVYCLDISNPASPTMLLSYPLDRDDSGGVLSNIGLDNLPSFPDHDPIDMLLAGDGAYLYVGNRKGGLQIYSTSAASGSNPIRTVVDISNSTLSVMGLASQGNYIYACFSSGGIKTVDVSNPATASIVGTTDLGSGYMDIAIEGSTAFATNVGTGVEVFDITDPAHVKLLRIIATEIGFGGMGTHSLALHEGYAYIFHHKSNLGKEDDKSLFKVDLNMPVGISLAASLSVPDATGIAIEGNRAYVAAGDSGLIIYDISNPKSPALLGSIATSDPAYKVFVKANRAYVVVNWQYYYSSNIEVYDVTDPAKPSKLGDLAGGGIGQIWDFVIRGDFAFVVGNYDVGFSIFDVSDPRNASLVRHHIIPFSSTSLSLSGRYALVAGGERTTTVFDIEEPRASTLVKTLPCANEITDFAMSGGYGFFSLSSYKFMIRDLTDPTKIDAATDKVFDFAAAANQDEWTDAVAGLDGYAVVSTLQVNASPRTGRLRIYDFSDFSSPRLISELTVDNFTTSSTEFNHEVKINGSWIYALGTDGLVRIYNMRP